jgi:hypothetical protein
MDGWVGGRMDEWMDGWVGGWMGGWMDGNMSQSYDKLCVKHNFNIHAAVGFIL